MSGGMVLVYKTKVVLLAANTDRGELEVKGRGRGGGSGGVIHYGIRYGSVEVRGEGI